MTHITDTRMFEAGELTFEQWRDLVDKEFVRLTEFEADDFADWHYADAYAEGVEPVEAARSALAADTAGEGFLALAGIDEERAA